jgi:mono/diheme cytochrome c family protein
MRRAAPGLAFAAALLLADCGERAPAVHFDPGPVPAEHAVGQRLFDAACAQCHGALAAGGDVGPPLVHVYYEPNHHADIAFQRAVQFGVRPHHWSYGPMPPVEGLAAADVARITAYVRWLQRRAGIY